MWSAIILKFSHIAAAKLTTIIRYSDSTPSSPDAAPSPAVRPAPAAGPAAAVRLRARPARARARHQAAAAGDAHTQD